MNMRIVYISHPVSGDVDGNLEKILKIVREINLNESDIVPFVPYWCDCHALDNNDDEEKARGFRNNAEFFKRGIIDELWVCGDHVSLGMSEEVELAKAYGIPVFYHLNTYGR